MVGDVLRLGLAAFSVLKHLNRVEKIPIVVAVNNTNVHVNGFTVHVNSDVIFCVNFYVVE